MTKTKTKATPKKAVKRTTKKADSTPKIRKWVSGWNPKGKGSHFIFLTAQYGKAATCSYRVRADRIDWIAKCNAFSPDQHTIVSVNGTALKVEEPPHLILEYIENPARPIIDADKQEDLDSIELHRKYGGFEGSKRYLKASKLPYPIR
jgi:hypothetical protein